MRRLLAPLAIAATVTALVAAPATATHIPTTPTPTEVSCSGFGFFGTARLDVTLDGIGGPIAGTVTVTGAGTTTTLTVNGMARLRFPQLLPGTYEFHVSYAGSERFLPSEGVCTLTIENSRGRATGGVLTNGRTAHAGFVVHSDGASVGGELNFTQNGEQYHAHEILAFGIAGTTAFFAGIGDDGRMFYAVANDANEPGDGDFFRLSVAGVEQTSGPLEGGNIQVVRDS